tara:strand:+ start:1166 stop:1303 length:138 start_codon:yes stop_codon:yes gene_type:complete
MDKKDEQREQEYMDDLSHLLAKQNLEWAAEALDPAEQEEWITAFK